MDRMENPGVFKVVDVVMSLFWWVKYLQQRDWYKAEAYEYCTKWESPTKLLGFLGVLLIQWIKLNCHYM